MARTETNLIYFFLETVCAASQICHTWSLGLMIFVLQEPRKSGGFFLFMNWSSTGRKKYFVPFKCNCFNLLDQHKAQFLADFFPTFYHNLPKQAKLCNWNLGPLIERHMLQPRILQTMRKQLVLYYAHSFKLRLADLQIITLLAWRTVLLKNVTQSSSMFKHRKLSIYCKSTIYFRRHKNIMVNLLNFNITYIIILATCFDSYESSSGIISRIIVHIVLQFLS